VRFADRVEAGEQLARALSAHAGADTVVLGIARGGVIVADAVARALDAKLDIVVPRKIGSPHNPELGLGAVAGGVRVLDEGLVRRLGVSEEYIEREIAKEMREVARRERAYRGDRAPAELRGRTAIVVDDGVATGGTAIAALRWARGQEPDVLVFATPLAPPAVVARLEAEADEVVVLHSPEPFLAVGEWYARFDQTSDAEVVAILARTQRSPA
jgi:putative phosphoribosyl transferase